MAWIESHQDLRNHPKLIEFAKRLNLNKAQAIGHLKLLWWWCIDYALDGRLDRFSPAQISAGAEFSENPGEFIQALAESGFIDRDPLRIHDWMDFCGDLIKKRLDYRKRKRRRIKHLGKSLRKPENSQHTNPIQTKPNQQYKDIPDNAFETIWQKYKRRIGRKAAERHFHASVKTTQDWLDIQNALENYNLKLSIEKTEEKFIQHGSTWFNNWRDWVSYKTENPNAPNGSTGIPALDAIARANREAAEARKKSAAGNVSAGL